jgi:hypothetical protein
MAEVIKVRNAPAQHIGVANSAPCPETNIVAKEITENGRYEARTEGVTGFDPVIVNVPSREEIGYENGYAAGYGKGSTDGYAEALAKRTELEVTANGEYIPEGESTGFSKVSVNLPSDTDTIDGIIDGTLTSLRNDTVTAVGERALSYRKFVSIDLPNVTRIEQYAISDCQNLTTLNLPSVTFLNDESLSYDYSLQTISLPSATYIGGRVFQRCRKLDYCDLPLATQIQTQAFKDCYSLKTLIVRSTSVCNLLSTTAFDGCCHILGTVKATYNPEGLKDGYIYVPKNLIEQYKVATNWATYADQFRAIEDYPEITGG